MTWWMWLIVGYLVVGALGAFLGGRAEEQRRTDKSIGWCRRCRNYTPPDYTSRRAGFREGDCSWGDWPWTSADAGRGCPGYEYDASKDKDEVTE